MADKLNEMFDAWRKTQPQGNENEFAAFQGGVTAGAVSMRERAIEAARKANGDLNATINAIGSLSDIPE